MVRAGLALNAEGMPKSELRVEFCDALFVIWAFVLPSSFVIRASSFFLIAIPPAAVRHSFLSPANSRSESPSPRSVGARPFFCAALAPVPIRPGDRADLRAWSPFGAVESRDTAVSPPTHDRDATPCSLFLQILRKTI